MPTQETKGRAATSPARFVSNTTVSLIEQTHPSHSTRHPLARDLISRYAVWASNQIQSNSPGIATAKPVEQALQRRVR